MVVQLTATFLGIHRDVLDADRFRTHVTMKPAFLLWTPPFRRRAP